LSSFGTSCSWPRVMSPTPGRSTLITSAPNQANSWVHVGPDWTWVKSRMRTPSSALPMPVSLLVSFAGPCGLVLNLSNQVTAASQLFFLAEDQGAGPARFRPAPVSHIGDSVGAHRQSRGGAATRREWDQSIRG